MLIKSFKIDHRKLKPGIYLHDVQKFGNSYVTTFDLRFKKPNKGDYLNNSEMHSMEHVVATFYSEFYPKDKIYFGPMGCQTGFYLVVYGQKTLKWLEESLVELNDFIITLEQMPGQSPASCGNHQSLNIWTAKRVWKTWYTLKDNWGKKY